VRYLAVWQHVIGMVYVLFAVLTQRTGFIISAKKTEQDSTLYPLEMYHTSQGEGTVLVGNLLHK